MEMVVFQLINLIIEKIIENISFCDNEELLIGIRDFISKELNIKPTKINNRKNSSQLFYCSSEDIEKISNYMYKNSTIYMIRKYEKFKIDLNFVNTEVKHTLTSVAHRRA